MVAFQQFTELGISQSRPRNARIMVGIWALYSALYLLVRGNLEAAQGHDEVIMATRLLDSTSYGIAPMVLMMVSTLVYDRRDRKLMIAVVATGSLAILPWLGHLVVEDAIHSYPSAEGGLRYRAQSTWLYEVSRVLWFAIGAVALRDLRRGRQLIVRRRRAASLAIAMSLLLAGMNDSLLAKALFPSIPLFDWACVFSLVLLVYVMVDRTSDELQASHIEIRSLESMRSLIDALPIGILVLRDGKIIRCNNAACSFLGQSDEQLTDTGLGEHVEELDQPWIAQLVDGAVLEPRRIIFQGEQGGAVGLVAAVRIDFEGRPSTVVIIHDMGQQENMEKQLRLADRLSSLGTLAAGMAHEINNPLAYILGNLEVLKEELGELLPPGQDAQRQEVFEMLSEIEFGAARVREVVTGLRVFGRSEDGKLGPIDVNRAVELAITLSQNEVRHVAELRVDLGKVPQVLASEGQLSQVILNLIVNAAQATYAPDKQPSVAVRTRSSASGQVVIEVQDNAEGLSPAQLARVFDPFYTTKDVGKGTGLGLSICHGLVAKFGGVLELESEPGRGTLARIEMPTLADVSEDSPLQQRITRSMPAVRDARQGRVLIIDDDPFVTRTLVRVLSELDCTVIHSGQEALERLRSESEFDVIICNLSMPGVSGAEVYTQASEFRPALAKRFLFLKGGAVADETLEFAESLDGRVLAKPVEATSIRTRVQNLLSENALASPLSLH